ncbi:MAG: DUF4624 family lipoprotein [Eubacteriales bacterium]|nr:DUF4624 family lipoprotein [Eubacteriales bacterium]
MKRFLPLLLCALLLLSGCTEITSPTLIQMEMTSNYDTSDPFINEKLFYMDKNINVLELDISIQMKGENGILEIVDNETKQVLWSDTWDGDVDETKFTVLLDTIETEKEYIIRFIGTKIEYAKVVITSKDNLVKEREKPLKPDRD